MEENDRKELKQVIGKAENIIGRLEVLQEQVSKEKVEIKNIQDRLKVVEGLDLARYLKEETDIDEVIDKRIANLLEIATQLKGLNDYKRDSIMDYLSKKSGTSKTKLNAVIRAFEMYLDKLL